MCGAAAIPHSYTHLGMVDFSPSKAYYCKRMMAKQGTHGQASTARIGVWLLTVMWLITLPPCALAGGPLSTEWTPGQTTPGRGDYSLLFAPVQPFGFPDLLTVSSIGEGRSPGLGRGAVSAPSAYYAAGMGVPDPDLSMDKSKSYLFSLRNPDQDNRYLGLARFDRFDPGQTGRTPFDEYRAELMIGYSVTSSGSILFGKGMQMECPGTASFKLLDDGWRFKFIKTF